MSVGDAGDGAIPTLPTSANASQAAVSWKVKCLNCSAALAGPFCADCGQRAIPPSPTVRQLVGDALSEFSGWDGKFAETLRLLVRQPGELTKQWLDGRRVHFISPLRLYLTASLVFFIASAAAPNLLKTSLTKVTVSGVDVTSAVPQSRPERVAAATQQALVSGKPLAAAQRDSILNSITKAPWIMRPMLTKAVDDPNAIKAGVTRWLPRMLFALIPLYAGILALFYRRRNYPEHLYFAIHLHAFVFLALTLSSLVMFTGLVALAVVTPILAALWIVAYAVVALRRVYGGSIARTVMKGIGIMALYGLVVFPALAAVVLLSAF